MSTMKRVAALVQPRWFLTHVSAGLCRRFLYRCVAVPHPYSNQQGFVICSSYSYSRVYEFVIPRSTLLSVRVIRLLRLGCLRSLCQLVPQEGLTFPYNKAYQPVPLCTLC